MSERRRQAASPGSLLVVTLLFVWACSSSDHEVALVTTSGGSGSELSLGGAVHSEAGAGAELEVGGTLERGPSRPANHGGAAVDSSGPRGELAGAFDSDESSGGAGPTPQPPSEMGGSFGRNDDPGTAGIDAPRGGTLGVEEPRAGAPSAAGSPAVSEPTCDPAEDHSTPDMFLPCEVSSSLYVCRNCHSNPPVKGVFTSYVTYADIKANAAQIYGVIRSGTMPWPPYTLSAWQKTTVLRWLGKNGSCALGAAKSCQ